MQASRVDEREHCMVLANRQLRRTRDLLLKIAPGEVDVEGLEIEVDNG